MKNKLLFQEKSKAGASLILLFILVVIAYSNSFHATWHLDDATNILDNQNVHVSTLSLDDWSRSIRPPFSDPTHPGTGFYRPIAMLSLAFNWYLGGADVFGYHLFNITTHCIAAGLLFFTILNLLRAPNLNGRYQGSEHFIALLATTLWALHPIQTQAVTYIVQRMTSLAALFYVCGILFFILGRKSQTPAKRTWFYGACFFSYLLAMGTKQNAVTLPAALLLIEVIFYMKPGFLKRGNAKWIGAGVIIGLVMFYILLLFYWQKNPLAAVMDGYRHRPFTLPERLLTEFRVLIFYLYQLFYPVPGQFSILHDVALSKSLVDPWTTSAAIVMIGSLLISAFHRLGRNALWSFAILFFFLGHSIESTIFPLELVFEHRNYLPSFFLFLPVASGVKLLFDKYKNRILYFILMGAVPIIMVGLGLGTFTRNAVWATEKSLWQDAIQKAPAIARSHQNLALALERENRLDEALILYRRALELKDPQPLLSRFISLANMGNIYKKRKNYKKAVYFLSAAADVETGPYIHRVRYNLVLCLLNSHREEEALQQLDLLLAAQKNNSRFLTAKGFIFFQRGETDLALRYLRLALKQNPYDKDTLLNLALALSAKGFYERAEWFLKSARNRYPENLVVHFALLQNALKVKGEKRVDMILADISRLFTTKEIKEYLVEHARGYHYINETLVPVDDAIILPPLVDFLNRKAEALDNLPGDAT